MQSCLDMVKFNLQIFTLLLILNVFIQKSYSQDYTYSQFYANPIYLNPALAGSAYCPRIILNYRNQWPSLPAAFVSYGASYDQFSELLSGGLGIQFNYNKSGEASLNEFQVTGMYAYQLHISENIEANLALQAGFGQRSMNWDNLIFASRIDQNTGDLIPAGPPPANFTGNVNYVDFATGVIIGFDEKYFVGAAVHHLSQPDIGFISESNNLLNMKITVHAGANFGTESRGYQRSYRSSLQISPNILYQQQGAFRHLNLGTYVTFEPLVVGLWYRHAFENPDAIIISIGLQHDNIQLGYSYDYTVSAMTIASGGAHEVTLAWTFDCDKKRKRSRAIKCPSF